MAFLRSNAFTASKPLGHLKGCCKCFNPTDIDHSCNDLLFKIIPSLTSVATPLFFGFMVTK